MKKIFLFVAIMLSALAQAQSFGIKGGVNFATLKGNDAGDANTLTGFHIGILNEWVIFTRLSLQPELLYSVQGAKIDDDEYKLNYVTLPIALKLYLTDAFSVHAGPQLGLLIGETDDVLPTETETFEYGAILGLDYALSNSFFIQGRYNAGFSEISKDADIKNSVIQISLGVTF